MSDFDELTVGLAGPWTTDSLGGAVLTSELIESAREDVAWSARDDLVQTLLTSVRSMTKVSRKAVIELLEEYEGA